MQAATSSPLVVPQRRESAAWLAVAAVSAAIGLAVCIGSGRRLACFVAVAYVAFVWSSRQTRGEAGQARMLAVRELPSTSRVEPVARTALRACTGQAIVLACVAVGGAFYWPAAAGGGGAASGAALDLLLVFCADVARARRDRESFFHDAPSPSFIPGRPPVVVLFRARREGTGVDPQRQAGARALEVAVAAIRTSLLFAPFAAVCGYVTHILFGRWSVGIGLVSAHVVVTRALHRGGRAQLRRLERALEPWTEEPVGGPEEAPPATFEQ